MTGGFSCKQLCGFIISGVSKIGGINEDTSVAVEDLIDKWM